MVEFRTACCRAAAWLNADRTTYTCSACRNANAELLAPEANGGGKADKDESDSEDIEKGAPNNRA